MGGIFKKESHRIGVTIATSCSDRIGDRGTMNLMQSGNYAQRTRRLNGKRTTEGVSGQQNFIPNVEDLFHCMPYKSVHADWTVNTKNSSGMPESNRVRSPNVYALQ